MDQHGHLHVHVQIHTIWHFLGIIMAWAEITEQILKIEKVDKFSWPEQGTILTATDNLIALLEIIKTKSSVYLC